MMDIFPATASGQRRNAFEGPSIPKIRISSVDEDMDFNSFAFFSDTAADLSLAQMNSDLFGATSKLPSASSPAVDLFPALHYNFPVTESLPMREEPQPDAFTVFQQPHQQEQHQQPPQQQEFSMTFGTTSTPFLQPITPSPSAPQSPLLHALGIDLIALALSPDFSAPTQFASPAHVVAQTPMLQPDQTPLDSFSSAMQELESFAAVHRQPMRPPPPIRSETEPYMGTADELLQTCLQDAAFRQAYYSGSPSEVDEASDSENQYQIQEQEAPFKIPNASPFLAPPKPKQSLGNRSRSMPDIRAETALAAPKRFVCDFEGCSRSFNHRSGFQEHRRTHTGERPFKCQVEGCGKDYTTLNRLKVHTRSHTGEKPFRCEYPGCAFGTTQSSNLKKHKMTHLSREEKQNLEASKEWECCVCGKRFEHERGLRHHDVTSHGAE